MPSAEIITIGTEILLGEIVDTNTQYIARKLRDIGIDLYRNTTIGDNANRIAQTIQQSLERCDIVITTGGLGPTVDDPTREAIALAFDSNIEFQPALWEQIQARFKRFGREPTENNRRQAYLPLGAHPIENPVGTAPAFYIEANTKTVITLPGVPREMEYLLENSVIPYLRDRYHLTGIIKARILHTAGVGESQIDEVIGDLETFSNPTIGLAAHSGQVDIRITAKADSEKEADAMIAQVEQDIRKRLGNWIYGADQETLEDIVFKNLFNLDWSLSVVEYGSGGALIKRLSSKVRTFNQELARLFRGGEVISERNGAIDLISIMEASCLNRKSTICLGIAIFPAGDKQDVQIAILSPNGVKRENRPFGGPPEYAPRWAVHLGLDMLRKLEKQIE